MSPLAYARDVLATLNSGWGTQLPEVQWAQYGQPIVTCESVAVGITDNREALLTPGDPSCAYVDVANLIIIIGRECAIDFSEAGHTVAAAATEISERMDADRAILDAFIDTVRRDLDGSAATTYRYVIEGAYYTVTVTTSVRVF